MACFVDARPIDDPKLLGHFATTTKLLDFGLKTVSKQLAIAEIDPLAMLLGPDTLHLRHDHFVEATE